MNKCVHTFISHEVNVQSTTTASDTLLLIPDIAYMRGMLQALIHNVAGLLDYLNWNTSTCTNYLSIVHVTHLKLLSHYKMSVVTSV